MKKHKQEPWAAKLGTTTLDPLQVMDLQDAVRARKKTAVVQGKKFLLSYKGEQVYYQPAEDGVFAPSGYLDIKRFLED